MLTVQHQRCQNQNTPKTERGCKISEKKIPGQAGNDKKGAGKDKKRLFVRQNAAGAYVAHHVVGLGGFAFHHAAGG